MKPAHLSVTLVSTCLLTGLSPAGLPQAWDIELVARSSETPGAGQFAMLSNLSIAGQHIAISEDGTVAIRVLGMGASIAEGVYVSCPDIWPSLGCYPVASPLPISLSGDLDIRNNHLAVLIVQDFGSPSPNEGVFVFDAQTGVPIADYPNLHPYYTIDSVSLAADVSVGVHTLIGLAGTAITLDESGPPRNTDVLISTLDDGNTTAGYLAPMMNGVKQFVSVAQPYFETPPGPPRRLITLEPSGAPEGYDLIVLDTGEGDIDRIGYNASISEDRRIAYHSRRTTDGVWQIRSIDVGTGTEAHIADLPLVDETDADNTEFRSAINSSGLVAFRDRTPSGTALLAGDGTGLVPIAAAGDLVMTDLGPMALGFDNGSGLEVLNGRIDINDSDQIAFTAWLENGTIGIFIASPAQGCTPADLAAPLGVLDLADLSAFVTAFVAGDQDADLADPAGVFDLADVQAFVASFTSGCP